MEPENKKKKYGFAAMSPEKRREISSKGGEASRDNGTLYKFTSEDCRKAWKRST
jgi:general stress protein YciG